RRGVLIFNGTEWTLINMPGSAYALITSEDKKDIYVSGKGFFGQIAKNKSGEFQFKNFSKDKPYMYNFGQILKNQNKLYFYAGDLLIEYDIEAEAVSEEWLSVNNQRIEALFCNDNKLYAQTSEREFFYLEGKKFLPSGFSLEAQAGYVSFTLSRAGGRKVLLGTNNGSFYYFNGSSINPVSWKKNMEDYLRLSQTLKAINIDNENQVAFATLRGGCIVADIQKGEVLHSLNYQNGLPDNEVLALSVDSGKGIWIAHEYGLTRADLQVPIRDFGDYPGLEGKITFVTRHHSKIYVATTQGVFYLDETRDYEEIEKAIFVKKKNDARLRQTNRGTSPRISQVKEKGKEELDNAAQKTKGFFGKINPFKGKKKNKEQDEEADSESTAQAKTVQNPTKKTEDEAQNKEQEEKEKKGLFGKVKKIFKKKDKSSNEQDEDDEKEVFSSSPAPKKNLDLEKSKEEPKPKQNNKITKKQNVTYTKVELSEEEKAKYEARKFLALQSTQYIFKRIEGIVGKTTQMLPYKDQLLVVSNAGLYRIMPNKEAILVSNEPAEYAYIYDKNQHIYVGTVENAVLSFAENTENGKLELQNKELFEDNVHRIVGDEQGNIWVCATDFIYRMQADEETGIMYNTESFMIDNTYSDILLPLKLKDTLYFILPTISYRFDTKHESFVQDTIIQQEWENAIEFIGNDEHALWINRFKSWTVLSDLNYKNENLIFLNALNDIVQIINDETTDHIWVITSANNLFRFHLNQNIEDLDDYALMLMEVSDKAGQRLPLSNLVLEHDNNTLSFSFVRPDFLSSQGIEYRYKLIGKMNDWSEWSHDGTVIFPALSSGKYKLKVESRDIFGKIIENEIIEFRIKPPYWKSAWFYALEILFFGSLILLTAVLNKRLSQNKKVFVFIRQTLTILTLILCAEFFKTVLEAQVNIQGSPVFDFAMEVFFAILIFPLERLLSYIITRARARQDAKIAEKEGTHWSTV
ncbi:MAG: hypothetical protein JJT94_05115, partial [Bernardetiaceae bacterium]|nr:hypothetical protein [Bernardetiaceae bacterium]